MFYVQILMSMVERLANQKTTCAVVDLFIYDTAVKWRCIAVERNLLRQFIGHVSWMNCRVVNRLGLKPKFRVQKMAVKAQSASVVFVNENENGEKRENNEFVNEN